MAPIPILYVIPRMSVGGAQTHLLEVLRLINRQRFAPILCCLTASEGNAQHLLQQVRDLDVPVLDAHVKSASNSLVRPDTFLQMWRMARVIRGLGVQIVHSYLFHGNWFGTLTAKLARVPVAIASKRNVDVYPRARDRMACRIVNHLADRVTAVSEVVKDHVQRTEGCPIHKLVVIPNGVDVERMRRPDEAPAMLPVELQESPRQKLIGSISRLVWYKGQEDLLTAAALVIPRYPKARFLLIGDGPLRQQLQDKAKTLGLNGSVSFLGSVPNASSLLPHLNLFVLPSLWEGMSNSLLEAMAVGKPVVATTVGGNPEVVVDGKTGLLVPPKDPQALAKAILCLLENEELAWSMGTAGKTRVESDFTLPKMVSRLEALYDSALAA